MIIRVGSSTYVPSRVIYVVYFLLLCGTLFIGLLYLIKLVLYSPFESGDDLS